MSESNQREPASHPELVLVTGATGNVGRHVVSGLLASGIRVRALSRDPGKAGLPAEVDVVRGDFTAPDIWTRPWTEWTACFCVAFLWRLKEQRRLLTRFGSTRGAWSSCLRPQSRTASPSSPTWWAKSTPTSSS